jgi:23S rRNA pseudouridine1911/1915/1917 synthase
MQKPDIIYEDEELIVCCKPAGIATQTKRLGQPDMESLLRNHIAAQPRKEGRSGIPYVGIVHRLDQPVEGVMVFAKTPQSAAALSAQVQDRSFGKKYYALVDLPQGATFASATGKPGQGSLCDWILFSPRENRSSIVPANTGGARKASLDYSVLAQQEDQALLDITLHTGRHHQIRVQLAHLHTPICGDAKYGSTARQGQLCLCSYFLSFEHPRDGRTMAYTITPGNEKIRRLLQLFTTDTKS